MSNATRRRELPEECPHCGEWITYYPDPDGVWAECDCSAGYLS